MSEAQPPKSRIKATEDRIDALLMAASERKKRSIDRSLARPLRTDVLRMLYLVGCVLLDLILIPSAMLEILDRPWSIIGLLILIPIAFIEFKLHQKWFAVLAPTES